MRALLVGLSLAVAACGGATPKPVSNDARPSTDARWYAANGEALPPAILLQRAVSADVVLMGEVHGNVVGHAELAGLWEEIASRRSTAALALEFFERDAQRALDDYLAGTIDERVLRERTARSAGNYPPGHQRMVETARAKRLPVVAANPPRRLVKLARAEGYEGLRALPAADQALFRLPETMPGGRYRSSFYEMMSSGHADPHGKGPDADALFRAQALWDSTMADSIAKALAAGRKPVVLVVGAFHVEWNGGVAQLLARYAPSASVVSVSVVERAPGAFDPADRARADALVYVGAPSP